MSVPPMPPTPMQAWRTRPEITREIGVATVPGSSFYADPNDGRHLVRFAFCKTEDVLEAAAERLAALEARV